VTGAAWSRRLVTEDRGWSSTDRVLGGWMIEKLGDTMCGLHRTRGDEEHKFLGLISKLRSTVSSGLASKLMTTVFVVWPQNHSLGFPGLGPKTGSCDLIIWALKSSRQFLGLGLKIKWAMVCQLCLKTDWRMKTAWDTRQDLRACFAWK
jgi:hypothetical protein